MRAKCHKSYCGRNIYLDLDFMDKLVLSDYLLFTAVSCCVQLNILDHKLPICQLPEGGSLTVMLYLTG